MNVIINPGTGPVEDATREEAERNIKQFISDLALPGEASYSFIKECRGLKTLGQWPKIEIVDGELDGRFEFEVTHEERTVSIEMPGLPLEKVRYLGTSQNIWDFPRLYVGGSSWVWCYGLGVARSMFMDEEDS